MSEPSELAHLAVAAATEAGELVKRRLPDVMTVETKSAPTDLVTDVDRSSEALLVERILAARPDDSILSEEGTAVTGRSGIEWICDPLDGTANYVRRRHPFVVSVAVRRDGKTVAAAVRDPWLDETFEAWMHGGSRLNGRALRCTTSRPLQEAVVATAFARTTTDRARQAAALARIVPLIGDIRRTGAAVYDICCVAANRAEGYFFEGLKPWDLFAAELIAVEAGAVSTALEGGQAEPDAPLVIAAPEIAQALRECISAARRE